MSGARALTPPHSRGLTTIMKLTWISLKYIAVEILAAWVSVQVLGILILMLHLRTEVGGLQSELEHFLGEKTPSLVL